MSITALSIVAVGDNAYRLSWASDAADPVTYRVYADGQLLATTPLTSLTVAASLAVVYEVLDTDAEPTAVHPAALTLAWYAADGGAATYRIEQYDGADWTTVTEIAADERTYYTFRTDPLADDTAHTFRVVPVSDAGNDGTPTVFAALVVRNPDPPQVDMTYNADDGTVSLTAA